MTWISKHQESERFASEAEVAKRMGRTEEARRLYHAAAEAEAVALSLVQPDKERTLGVTAISAASLFFKADNLEAAERLAFSALANEKMPKFARSQLQNIVQTIWNEKAFKTSGVEFVRGELVVSVAGGLIAVGAAPLELVHRKVDEIKNLFFRTVEMLLSSPVRRRGIPSHEIRDQFRPWIVQAPAGSYQFALRVEKPRQMGLFPYATAEVEQVTSKLLHIVEVSSIGDFETLDKIVPNEDYRECFLKQVRNLAPTGKTFNSLTIRSAETIDTPIVTFSPESRKVISESIRSRAAQREPKEPLSTEKIVGVLRALHLDKDWLEVVIPDTGAPIRIYQAGDAIDDVIGPMVNHTVEVEVVVHPDGKRTFKDIQSEE